MNTDRDLRCPHCLAGEPSVWDDVLAHYAHPAEGDKLKMCHDPWRDRCRRCSGDVSACVCPRPIAILVASKARLLTKGWTRGIGRCLYMTIEAVVPDDKEWYGSAPQVSAFAALRIVTGSESLATWNDQQTSIAAVIDAIDRAIGVLDAST